MKLERNEASRVRLMYKVRLENWSFAVNHKNTYNPCKRGKITLNIMLMIRNEKNLWLVFT